MAQQKKQADTSKLCRACSGGKGDGICSYHANQFRKMGKRLDTRMKGK